MLNCIQVGGKFSVKVLFLHFYFFILLLEQIHCEILFKIVQFIDYVVVAYLFCLSLFLPVPLFQQFLYPVYRLSTNSFRVQIHTLASNFLFVKNFKFLKNNQSSFRFCPKHLQLGGQHLLQNFQQPCYSPVRNIFLFFIIKRNRLSVVDLVSILEIHVCAHLLIVKLKTFLLLLWNILTLFRLG